MSPDSYLNASLDYELVDDMLEQMRELCEQEGGWNDRLVESIALYVLVAAGLVGNALVVFVVAMLHDYTRSRPGWMLIQMLVANILFIVCVIIRLVADSSDKWTAGVTSCKIHTFLTTSSLSNAVVLLMVTNIERAVTYIGPSFPQRIASLCSRRGVGMLTCAIIWMFCLGSSAPQWRYAGLGICERCSMIHPLNEWEICEFLKLNATECKEYVSFQEFVTVHSLDPGEFEDDMDHAWRDYMDYYPLHEYGDDQRIVSAQVMYEFEEHMKKLFAEYPLNETKLYYPCKHDQPQHFFRLLYTRFVVFFVFPVVSMLISASAMHKHKKMVSTSPGADACGQWMLTVLSLNCLFLVCWLPYHVISLGRVGGLGGSEQTCSALNSFAHFMVVAYHAIFPFVYMLMTRNFRIQFLTSVASISYCVPHRTKNDSLPLRSRRCSCQTVDIVEVVTEAESA